MSKDTKERLLDAAERLCAEQGIDGTSVRNITDAAGANVASVSFHFGDKQGLIKALFKRRLEPLAAARLTRLALLQVNGSEPTISDLLDAFMIPLIEQMNRPDTNSQAFARLFARTVIEPTPAISELFGKDMADYTQTLLAAMQDALPHLGRKELILRFDFAVGAIAHALSDPTRRQAFNVNADLETIDGTLKAFLIAGLEAPATLEET
jgi:AcrR family transcriptional regulator